MLTPAVIPVPGAGRISVPKPAQFQGQGGFAAGPCRGQLLGFILGCSWDLGKAPSELFPTLGGCRGQGHPRILFEEPIRGRKTAQLLPVDNLLNAFLTLLMCIFFPCTPIAAPSGVLMSQTYLAVFSEALSPHREGSSAVFSLYCRINNK